MPSPFTDQKKRKKMTIVSCAANIFAPYIQNPLCIEGLYPFLFLSFVLVSQKYFAL